MNWGLAALLAGIVSLIAGLEAGAGAEIVTVPLLLAGLGVGALASQLGAVTVSSVPDELSGEVGGLQNTATNLGASLGTALAGSVLIGALAATFFQGIQDNPDVPAERLGQRRGGALRAASPSCRTPICETALEDAGLSDEQVDAIVDENEAARIAGLRLSLAVLALLAAVALFFTRAAADRARRQRHGRPTRPRAVGLTRSPVVGEAGRSLAGDGVGQEVP